MHDGQKRNAMTENVAAIVETARDQATGLKEINTAVNTTDQATQQNAAMAEESTAASAELAARAADLQLALARLNIQTGTSRADGIVRRGRSARRLETSRKTPAAVPPGCTTLVAAGWPRASISGSGRPSGIVAE